MNNRSMIIEVLERRVRDLEEWRARSGDQAAPLKPGRILSTDQLAATGLFSRRWLDERAKDGRGPAFSQSRFGAARYYVSEDVMAWIDENKVRSTHEVVARERAKNSKPQVDQARI